MADQGDEPKTAAERKQTHEADEPIKDPASDRIWESPMPLGDPIPFDPELYEPTLSPEELEKLFAEDDDDGDEGE